MSDGAPTIQPTNPYHIARAYGVQPPARTPAHASPVSGVEPAGRISPVSEERVPSRDNPGISRLLGARVPGGVEFSGDDAMPRKGEMIIPFYRHPADRNAAATNIQIGRALDVTG